MSPLRLTPSFREKVWGSTQLEPWFPNTDRKIGEVWFEGADIPLLVKFIFTSEKLSVQVHPDDDYARVHHNSRGKTEMWHILAAEPGAKIAAGFREPISRDRLKDAALSGEIETLLQWFDAKRGDTFFIPAGTVHAIGAGLVLCEIQQNSDVTYRLYDYGRPRELHLDRAIEVSNLGPIAARAPVDGEVLVSCDHFKTFKSSGKSSGPLASWGEKDAVLVVLDGEGLLNGGPIRAGDAWHIPMRSATTELSGNVTMLTACFEKKFATR